MPDHVVVDAVSRRNGEPLADRARRCDLIILFAGPELRIDNGHGYDLILQRASVATTFGGSCP